MVGGFLREANALWQLLSSTKYSRLSLSSIRQWIYWNFVKIAVVMMYSSYFLLLLEAKMPIIHIWFFYRYFPLLPFYFCQNYALTYILLPLFSRLFFLCFVFGLYKYVNYLLMTTFLTNRIATWSYMFSESRVMYLRILETITW